MNRQHHKTVYRSLFFDLDRTLWDFDSSALKAIQTLFEKHEFAGLGIPDSEEFYRSYTHHNTALWDLYRVGEITKEKLRWWRFFITLLDFGIENKELSVKIGEEYLQLIQQIVSLFPNAENVLDYLAPKYDLHLITNGFSEVQETKLRISGLDNYFLTVVTSEEAGCKKPDRKIFDYAIKKSGAKIDSSIMIGDDPDVDILGAKNAGMDQVLFDPKNIHPKNGCTFYITDLAELKVIF